MSDINAAHRLRLIVALVLSLALALGSLWVREVIRRNADDAKAQSERTDPDYFVNNFHFIKTSTLGKARYDVSGVRLTHYPKDDSFEITKPIVKSLELDRPSTTATAERAKSNGDNSLVEMFDNVQVERPESKLAPHFRLTTDYLQLLPDDDVMKTEHAVALTQGATDMTGEGLYANNATLVYSLANHVHAIIHPQKHDKK